MKVIKTESKYLNGTSFHNGVLQTTYNKLVETFGEPEYEDFSGRDKVSCEWELQVDINGELIHFAIYDWKEYGYAPVYPKNRDTEYSFHIGTHSSHHTNILIEYFEMHLPELNPKVIKWFDY